MLTVGTKAPAFTLMDKDGKEVSLADFRARKLFCTSIPRIIRLAAPSRLVPLVPITAPSKKRVLRSSVSAKTV